MFHHGSNHHMSRKGGFVPVVFTHPHANRCLAKAPNTVQWSNPHENCCLSLVAMVGTMRKKGRDQNHDTRLTLSPGGPFSLKGLFFGTFSGESKSAIDAGELCWPQKQPQNKTPPAWSVSMMAKSTKKWATQCHWIHFRLFTCSQQEGKTLHVVARCGGVMLCRVEHQQLVHDWEQQQPLATGCCSLVKTTNWQNDCW